MINLKDVFRNFFDSERISDNKLNKFTEDHLGRLIANNGSGMFNTVIADTTAAYQAYFGKMSGENISTAVRQSLSMSAGTLMRTFKETVSLREGTIRILYGKKSPDYQQFFPHGLKEYHWANKNKIELLMTRFIAAANSHSADLGAPFITLFTGLFNNYKAARDAQLTKKGDVSLNKVGRASTRRALELQLSKNVHTVGAAFPGVVNKCMSFFDQSILRPRKSKAHDGIGQAVGIITAGGVPVNGAVIEVVGGKFRKVKSKADGHFRSPNVPTGLQILRVIKPGFKIYEKKIEIKDDGDTPFDVELEKE